MRPMTTGGGPSQAGSAASLAYTPATPGNWPTPPTKVGPALDELASLGNNAVRVPYSPGAPGNWVTPPTQVAQALDELAASVILPPTWHTVMDLDLTVQTPATFPTDGNVTIAGMTWVKVNSSHEVNPAAIVSGFGLQIQPTAISDYNGGTRTVPGLWLALSQIAGLPATFEWLTPLRLYASTAGNYVQQYDSCLVCLDHNDTATFGYVQKIGYTPSGAGMSDNVPINNGNGGLANTQFSVGGLFTQTLACSLPMGLGGGQMITLRGAAYSGGWPARSAMLLGSGSYPGQPNTQVPAMFGSTFTANNWGIYLAGQRSGSSTALVCTFSRIRLDLLY